MTLLELAEKIFVNDMTIREAGDELYKIIPVDKKQEQLIHFLYHYISDNDIRKRDPDYETIQKQVLSKMIDELKMSRGEWDIIVERKINWVLDRQVPTY